MIPTVRQSGVKVSKLANARKRNSRKVALARVPNLHQLATVERSDFIVVDLPENVVTVFLTERFQFGRGEEVEQNGVDVAEVNRDRMRQ